jgi:hypothetical protein
MLIDRPVTVSPADKQRPLTPTGNEGELPIAGSRGGEEDIEDYAGQIASQALAFKSSHAVSPFKT